MDASVLPSALYFAADSFVTRRNADHGPLHTQRTGSDDSVASSSELWRSAAQALTASASESASPSTNTGDTTTATE